MTVIMVINHCTNPSSKNQIQFWYENTILEELTGIEAKKLVADNLCSHWIIFSQKTALII
jgi:hypothetical protein